MSYTLKAHQHVMLEHLTNNDRFLLLPEAGAMKTLPCVIHLSNLYLGGEIEDALIVAPLSGLGAWYRDIEKLSPERRKLIYDKTEFCNWDKLSRKKDKKTGKGGKWQEKYWRSWGALFLDEGHAIANPTSNRTQYFVGRGKALGLASKVKHVYDITGTLLNNSRLKDAWAPLRLILGDAWEYYQYPDFERHFCTTITLPGSYAKIVTGYRHREELLELLGRYSYRILLSECLDLPAVLPDELITVPFATGKNAAPFNKSTKDIYDDALDSYVDAIDMVMDNPLTRRLRIRQIATGHVKESDTVTEAGRKVKGQTHLLKSDKTRYAMELIENNLSNKTVVGYQFRATCESLEKALKKAKISYLTLNGDSKDKLLWRKFQADDSIKVFVVQYKSGSESIDLFASHYTIFMEPMDSSRTCIQFRNRTNRNGQVSPCAYVWLLTEGTIEWDMYKRLQDHRDWDDSCWREIAMRRKAMRGEGK
jgi:SNF2 family DNA or RNA helicase